MAHARQSNNEFDDVRKLETVVGVLELELLNEKRVLQREIKMFLRISHPSRL